MSPEAAPTDQPPRRKSRSRQPKVDAIVTPGQPTEAGPTAPAGPEAVPGQPQSLSPEATPQEQTPRRKTRSRRPKADAATPVTPGQPGEAGPTPLGDQP